MNLSGLGGKVSRPGVLFTFTNSVSSVLFVSPTHDASCLLLVSSGRNRGHCHVIPLSVLRGSVSVRPGDGLILMPRGNVFIFTRVLVPRLIGDLSSRGSLRSAFSRCYTKHL